MPASDMETTAAQWEDAATYSAWALIPRVGARLTQQHTAKYAHESINGKRSNLRYAPTGIQAAGIL